MKKVVIIGAGQLGSRHLQALKYVKSLLDIYIIDPVNESLNIARERYDSLELIDNNNVIYMNSIEDVNIDSKIDLVIIATSSNVRSFVTIELLKKFAVDTIIFEKILFQKKDDYFTIRNLLDKCKVNAYVNCPMRMMSFYKDIKPLFKGTKFKYLVSGGQFGLVTNIIHYLDHMSFLSNSYEYEANVEFLDKEIIKSKRDGFYELNGTFQVYFENGTEGSFYCASTGNAPIVVQAYNSKIHFISMESEGKVFIAKAESDWKWEEISFNIPFQSQLTTTLVEDLFDNNTCLLPTYEESMRIHLPYLDSLLDYINQNDKLQFDYYPFT